MDQDADLGIGGEPLTDLFDDDPRGPGDEVAGRTSGDLLDGDFEFERVGELDKGRETIGEAVTAHRLVR